MPLGVPYKYRRRSTMKRKLPVLFLSVSLFANADDTIRVCAMRYDLEAITDQLSKQSISVKDLGENCVAVKRNDLKSAASIIANYERQFDNRDRAFLEENLFVAVIGRMAIENIEFEVKCIDNREVILWEREYLDRMIEILDEENYRWRDNKGEPISCP